MKRTKSMKSTKHTKRIFLTAILGVVACVGTAFAQRTVNFDAQTLVSPPVAAGVTFQLYVFSSGFGFAWPTTPGTFVGGGIVSMTGVGPTSSGTRAVRIPQASAGFSTEGVRMLFAVPQTDVKFTVGSPEVAPGISRFVYRVSGYNAAGGLVYTSDYSTPNTSVDCRMQVHVTALASNPVTRIDFITLIPNASGVLTNGGWDELFDTLVYTADATPPSVNITVPADDVCVSDSLVAVTGYSYEPDGTYVGDMLEFGPHADGPWTLIGAEVAPVAPPGGALYNWNTAAVTTGHYYLRFTATNADGLETQVIRRVYVDGLPPSINLRSPVMNQIVGGNVCFDGTVQDACSSTYTLDRRASGAGAFVTFATGTAVINDPLGTWNTLSPLVPDGSYDVRVAAVDGYANASTLTKQVIVDNTAPTAAILTPTQCEEVSGIVTIAGTALDSNLSSWALQYSSPLTGGWVTITTSASNVNNTTLATWNTAGLPSCAYTLRLLVSDRAVVNCDGGHTTERLVNVDVVQPGECNGIDFNNDGVFPDSADIEAYLRVFGGGSCGG